MQRETDSRNHWHKARTFVAGGEDVIGAAGYPPLFPLRGGDRSGHRKSIILLDGVGRGGYDGGWLFDIYSGGKSGESRCFFEMPLTLILSPRGEETVGRKLCGVWRLAHSRAATEELRTRLASRRGPPSAMESAGDPVHGTRAGSRRYSGELLGWGDSLLLGCFLRNEAKLSCYQS